MTGTAQGAGNWVKDAQIERLNHTQQRRRAEKKADTVSDIVCLPVLEAEGSGLTAEPECYLSPEDRPSLINVLFSHVWGQLRGSVQALANMWYHDHISFSVPELCHVFYVTTSTFCQTSFDKNHVWWSMILGVDEGTKMFLPKYILLSPFFQAHDSSVKTNKRFWTWTELRTRLA